VAFVYRILFSSASLLMRMTHLVVIGNCLFDSECTAHDLIGSIGCAWFVDERVPRESDSMVPWCGCAFVQFIPVVLN
jgi:hypothetical protein